MIHLRDIDNTPDTCIQVDCPQRMVHCIVGGLGGALFYYYYPASVNRNIPFGTVISNLTPFPDTPISLIPIPVRERIS